MVIMRALWEEFEFIFTGEKGPFCRYQLTALTFVSTEPVRNERRFLFVLVIAYAQTLVSPARQTALCVPEQPLLLRQKLTITDQQFPNKTSKRH